MESPAYQIERKESVYREVHTIPDPRIRMAIGFAIADLPFNPQPKGAIRYSMKASFADLWKLSIDDHSILYQIKPGVVVVFGVVRADQMRVH